MTHHTLSSRLQSWSKRGLLLEHPASQLCFVLDDRFCASGSKAASRPALGSRRVQSATIGNNRQQSARSDRSFDAFSSDVIAAIAEIESHLQLHIKNSCALRPVKETHLLGNPDRSSRQLPSHTSLRWKPHMKHNCMLERPGNDWKGGGSFGGNEELVDAEPTGREGRFSKRAGLGVPLPTNWKDRIQ
jgi:hypothetical protein